MSKKKAVEILEAVKDNASRVIDFVYPGFSEAVDIAIGAIRDGGCDE